MKESQNIEWKESWRDDYLKWICGFANAQGGKIYIGTKDDGTIVGIKNSKRLLEDIPNKIQTTLGIVADINLLSDADKEYIEISINPSSFPVNYKGEYHYRSGSTKQQLTGIALTDFLSKKMGTRWEDAVITNVSVDDLDKESFDIFRREALRHKRMTKDDLKISNQDLLERLELVQNGSLTRAAVLLFHRHPEKWFHGAYSKIGKFHGAEIEYMDEVYGSLFLQADRIIDLIYLKYLKALISYHKETRVETYPFARDAVREAVYNALIHSYWGSGIPVQIKIDDDAMYISNDCVFPTDWTVENLLQPHRSRPYNPHIAGAFYRAGYVESWGRGIKKIQEACNEYGTDDVAFVVHSGDFMIILPALKAGLVEKFDKKSNGALNGALNDNEQKIINLIVQNPNISQSNMSDATGLTRRQIQRILKKLMEAGYITREGSKKTGRWAIVHHQE